MRLVTPQRLESESVPGRGVPGRIWGKSSGATVFAASFPPAFRRLACSTWVLSTSTATTSTCFGRTLSLDARISGWTSALDSLGRRQGHLQSVIDNSRQGRCSRSSLSPC